MKTSKTPTFNKSGTLPRLYNSLSNQTDQDFLLLLGDDGSTDNAEDLVKKWINNKN